MGRELAPGSRSPAALAYSVGDRFERRAGRHIEPSLAASATGTPQHSFHVFAVYPWVGLLRAGTESPALEVLDRCRIRWGVVEVAEGDVVAIRSRPLRFDGSRLVVGPPQVEQAQRSLNGVGFATDLEPGDTVALHWDWVCDRLTTRQERWLRYCTQRNLDAVNSLARPGPAVALGA